MERWKVDRFERRKVDRLECLKGKHFRSRRARAYNLWVKGLALYRLELAGPCIKAMLSGCRNRGRISIIMVHTEGHGHEHKNEQREIT